MSEITPAKPVDENPPPTVAAKTDHEKPHGVILVPYPKVVFLYPSYFVAFVAAIIMATTSRATADPNDILAVVITWLFLGVLTTNFVVISFDFPRATSLTMFFLATALVLGAILLFTLKPDLLPAVTSVIQSIRPVANATFFVLFVTLMTVLYAAVLISVRFDYWEVRHNELLHHHGMLSDLKRYSAPGLRIDKEISDIFEYMLLRSGRLILQPSGERRAIILDNVLFINQKEEAITRMLGTLQVEVQTHEK